MIWPFYMVVTLGLALASRRPEMLALLLIAAGLVLVWLAKVWLPEPAFWVFSALIWVLIGHGVGVITDTTIPAVLLVVAGLLVIPPRVAGEAYEIGQPLLVASDICGMAAVLGLGWPCIREGAGRVHRLLHRLRGRRVGANLALREKEKP